MPLFPIRRALALALLAGLSVGSSACERESEGAVRVAVIGEPPKLVDPSAGPLTTAEEVLLANVAQGLVRFDARGQIEPGLAERWNVSDDGLSYIFRLSSGDWPHGGRITAHQVARLLRRTTSASSENPLKDTMGAIDEIVAMTDRVLEIRLKAPRPNLLQLLAQPEFAIVRNGQGTGPFELQSADGPAGAALRLRRRVAAFDEEEQRLEEIRLTAAEPPAAVRAFAAGELDLVLGGTFADLPAARSMRLPRGSLQFDPVAGLFGLVPARAGGPLADVELRRLLAQALDREALIAALDVPGLIGRATVLEAGLDGVPDPVTPAWMTIPIGERRPHLIGAADRFVEGEERPVIRVALGEGPGAELLLRRLGEDWALLGFRVERAGPGRPADLRLVDAVAPSVSPAWFLRSFQCSAVPVCDEMVDELLEAARDAPVAAQRAALLAEASRRIDEMQLFIPIAAPVRWSLVSDRIRGFAGNRFGRHTLTALDQQLNPERAQ